MQLASGAPSISFLSGCACVPSGRVLMGSKGAGGDWESAQRIRKEPRVLIYALHACPAQSQLQLPVRMCVCVSKDTTYAHGDMPTHDFVDTRGRWQSQE